MNQNESSPRSGVPACRRPWRGMTRRAFAGGGLLSLPLIWRHSGLSIAVTSTSASRVAVGSRGAASPAASPAAATAVATPRLSIVRDQRPHYREMPVQGGTLRMVRPPGDRRDFSPVAFRQDFQVPISYLDPLVRPDEVTMEPGHWLAEKWEWSDGGRVITYTLRSDVAWHDGTQLNAVDVAFSFYVYRDDVDSNVRHLFASMVAAEAMDDRTVRVTLSRSDGGWLFNASSQLIFQRSQYVRHWMSRPAGERTLSGFDWGKNFPQGTGPWRIADWNEDSVAFARNEAYWSDPPAFERMILTWEESPARQLSSWRAGDVDIVWPISAEAVDRVDDTNGRLYVADAASVMFAAFNFGNSARDEPGIFHDVRVRQALSLAIDRRRYATEVFGTFIRQRGAGTVAQPWANDPELTSPLQDLTAARDLLTTAGWVDADGDGVLDDPSGQPLALSVIVREDARPELLAVLASLAGDFASVGIVLDVQPLGLREFQERSTATRDFDLAAFAYDLYPGFTDFDLYGSEWDVRHNPQGFNVGGYQNDEVDAAIKDALSVVAVAAQRDALLRLQRAADKDLFGLWLGFPRELILVRESVLGFQPNKVWQTADTRKLWLASEGKG